MCEECGAPIKDELGPEARKSAIEAMGGQDEIQAIITRIGERLKGRQLSTTNGNVLVMGMGEGKVAAGMCLLVGVGSTAIEALLELERKAVLV